MQKRLLMLSMCALVALVGCGKTTENTNNIEQTTEKQMETEIESETETSEDSKYILNKRAITNQETSTPTEEETDESETMDTTALDYLAFAEYQMDTDTSKDVVAVLHVKDYGDIKIKLFSEAAPKAVENFTTHATEGYYDGLTFHRVINEFMIQGGDPNGNSTGGESIWGDPFENECTLELVPYKGALCMANQGVDNTNTSQFFIVTANPTEEISKELATNNYPESLIEAYKIYGGSPWLYQGYTVFGQVVEGLEVVEEIQTAETDTNDKPVKDVIVESIEIINPE